MNTPHTMTLYNKYKDEEGKEQFIRRVLTGVKWENRKAANVLQSGLQQADSVVIYIPKAMLLFMAPKAWSVLEEKEDFWTLQPGDYAVKGVAAEDIEEEFTLTMLKAKYDDVVKITTVDTMDAGSESMHHWQVGGQ